MDKYLLSVATREEKTPNQLRREGIVPGTIYGPQFDSVNLQFCAKEFSRLPAAAFSHLVDLNYEDGKKVSVIIRKVQRKATTGQVLNVEFYKIKLDRKLTVSVPIKLKGTAPAVVKGAQLMEVALTADVECFPGDIPDFIEGDLSKLKEADDIIHFQDLEIDEEKIRILNPAEGVVAKAMAPRVAAGAGAAAGAATEEAGEEAAEGAGEEAKEEAAAAS
ncbi:MAG: 50S ribosomal protein L25 [Candidatus Obscuribacterales bacterium]|nr:50S ribosomal protein L25 [Candidatus Obscuribacterales bacterium]